MSLSQQPRLLRLSSFRFLLRSFYFRTGEKAFWVIAHKLKPNNWCNKSRGYDTRSFFYPTRSQEHNIDSKLIKKLWSTSRRSKTNYHACRRVDDVVKLGFTIDLPLRADSKALPVKLITTITTTNHLRELGFYQVAHAFFFRGAT